jgi:hypothetical protein
MSPEEKVLEVLRGIQRALEEHGVPADVVGALTSPAVEDMQRIVEVVKAARVWYDWRTIEAPIGDGFSLAERYLVDMLTKLGREGIPG